MLVNSIKACKKKSQPWSKKYRPTISSCFCNRSSPYDHKIGRGCSQYNSVFDTPPFHHESITYTAQQSYPNSMWFGVLFIWVYILRLLKIVSCRLQHVYHSLLFLRHSLVLFLSTFAGMFISPTEFEVLSPACEASFPFLTFFESFFPHIFFSSSKFELLWFGFFFIFSHTLVY